MRDASSVGTEKKGKRISPIVQLLFRAREKKEKKKKKQRGRRGKGKGNRRHQHRLAKEEFCRRKGKKKREGERKHEKNIFRGGGPPGLPK